MRANRSPAVVAAFLLAGAAALSGCGQGSGPAGTSASRSTSSTASSGQPSPARRRPRRRRPAGARIGASQVVHAGGSALVVKIGPVWDPLRDSGSAVPAGMTAVGVVVTIHNRAGTTYDSTASGDVAVLTSAGPAAPLFIRSGRCRTPLTDFESLIGPGETRTGCVGFAVSLHARIAAVRFSPHSRASGSVVWR